MNEPRQKEWVVKGYYVMRPVSPKPGAREKAISRIFHVREAAERFRDIANIGCDEQDRAVLREKAGWE